MINITNLYEVREKIDSYLKNDKNGTLNKDKLAKFRQTIDNYLNKHDGNFKRLKDEEITVSTQRKDLSLVNSEKKRLIEEYKKLLLNMGSVHERFDGSLGSLNEVINKRLTETVGSIFDAFQPSDIQAFLKKIQEENGRYLDAILKAISSFKIPEYPAFPKKFSLTEIDELKEQIKKVETAVKQIKQPEIDIPDKVSILEAKEIIKKLEVLDRTIKSLPQNMPKSSSQTQVDFSEVNKALEKVEQAIKRIPQPEKLEFPEFVNIGNFPPQKIPQPVTNININPLRGFVKTTNTDVTTALTTLPGYGVLINRRGLIVYNNSSQNIFIGGSDVTSVNGLPIAPGTFSPTMDSGPKMIVYGIVDSGTANARVMELSNDLIGG